MRASLLGALVLIVGGVSWACASSSPRSGFVDDDDSGVDNTSSSSSSSGGAAGGLGNDAGPPPDATGSDQACAGSITALTRSAVYMHVIMDGSGSMMDPLVENGPTGLKWQAARDAMVSFIDDAESKADESFGLGLFLFDGTLGVPEFTTWDIGVAFVSASHATLLRNRIKLSSPQGGTPIKRALEGQIPMLTNLNPPSPLVKDGKRVLVVMTDGVPDGPSDIQPQVQQQCVDLVQSARDQATNGITTFAIGVGNPTSADTTYNEMFIGRLAMAGGAPTPNCMPGWNESAPSSAVPCHFQVTPGQKTASQIRDELRAAIDKIRGAAASCEFKIEKTPGGGASGIPDPKKVNVAITDAATGKRTWVPKDATNGWSFDNETTPTHVTLNGQACAKAQATTSGKVEIELGCTSRVN